MTPTVLHATPRAGRVLMAQVRAVGHMLRGPALVAGPLAALAMLFGTLEMRGSDAVHFHPERQEMLFGLLGVLLPVGIWMGEERIGSGFLWTLPVNRRWHALAKVCAGWVWLMGAVALIVLWLLGIAVASGGSLLAGESLRLLLDDGVVQSVDWMPQPVLWLVPFTAATATYLLASALALGTRPPLRWAVGTVLALFLIVGFAEDTNSAWMATAPGRALRGIFDGPYGLDAVLTARTGSLKSEIALPTGETVVVWRALPDLTQWVIATLLWTAAGVVSLIAAASRHGERR
jgi:hypothetical protein